MTEDRSFEALLADPHEQFDARSELLASITEYAAAPPLAVSKTAHFLPMSAEAVREAQEDAEAWRTYWNATPQQREQWAREAAERREFDRASTPLTPLSLDALLTKLGWSREYAHHLVQSYCTCSDGYDGWDYCQHAQDLGWT